MTWKNVLGMLLLVALCAVGLWVMDDSGPAASGKPNYVVAAFDKAEVSRLEAKASTEETLILRRRPDDSESWDLDIDQEWARANAIAIDEILNALMRADVMNHFPIAEVTNEQLTSYGLTVPKVRFRLEVPSGERVARFGTYTREGSGAYADRGPGTDVMVVPAVALREFEKAFNSGLRDTRVTDLRTYDVKTVEIIEDGVTSLEAEKDLTQVWRTTQPYKGYLDNVEFETRVSHLVNEQWSSIAEDGAQDLQRYGLVKPQATIKLTSKRGTTHTMLLGAPLGDGSGNHFFSEAGYHSVYVVSKKFADSVLADASEMRDRSFTRLGLGIESFTAAVGDGSFELLKAHDWEVEKPIREPAEESAVEDFLEQVRQWPVVEFLDGEDPAAFGVGTDEGHEIQVGTHGGAITTLLIGKQRADGNYYAQRKDDGGLVVVLGSVVEQVKKGWLQFKRRSALELPIDDLDFIGREPGFLPEGAHVTAEKWRRDLDGQDKRWKPEIGQIGAGLDAAAIGEFLATLRSIRALEWLHWDIGHNEEFGFKDGGGATTWMELDFRSSKIPTYLIIGKKVEGRDAYYARDKGKHFAFLMDAATAAKLTQPLMKQE